MARLDQCHLCDDVLEYIALAPWPAEQLVTGQEIQAESRRGSTV
jgi:hypothetical protein